MHTRTHTHTHTHTHAHTHTHTRTHMHFVIVINKNLSESKFWKSTRKIRVISQVDYSAFKGKKQRIVRLSPVSSDSETEEPSRKHRSISDEQQQEIGAVLSRIDEMERTLKSSMNQVDTVTELKKSISLLESECAKQMRSTR